MHVYSQGLALLVIGMGLGEVISRILGFLMVGSESHMFSVSLVALFLSSPLYLIGYLEARTRRPSVSTN